MAKPKKRKATPRRAPPAKAKKAKAPRRASPVRADKAKKPRGLKAKKPVGLKAKKPVGLKAKKPVGLKAKKPVGLKAKKPVNLKTKTAAKTRRVAKAIGKVARKPFAGGLTKTVAKGYRAVRDLLVTPPRTYKEKEKALAKIGIKPFKSKRKRTPAQRRKIGSLFSEFAEFTGRDVRRMTFVQSPSADTLARAKKSGMAVYRSRIYLNVDSPNDSARLGKFMGEKIIARTYFDKTERIFLGGADVFERVIGKLRKRKPKRNEWITGSFFGLLSFKQAYPDVGAFLNYLNNSFTPHLPKGVRPTKRNLAKAKAALIKNIAVVSIDAGEDEYDEENDEEI